jgi:hypothetical protein
MKIEILKFYGSVPLAGQSREPIKGNQIRSVPIFKAKNIVWANKKHVKTKILNIINIYLRFKNIQLNYR